MAPRIPDSVWERYRGEITDLYFAPKGTLLRTRKTMRERHGFEATKNQYALKLENWGLKKYAKNGLYLYADQKQRKRKLQEGKDTEFAFYGRKRSRSEMDKEIARHVTLTNRLQLWEDIPTPEGVEIFTPGAEDYSASVTVRDVFINNLPLFQLQRAIQALMLQIINNQTSQSLSVFNTISQADIQLDLLHRPQSTVKLLQMVLGDVVQPHDNLHSGSDDEISSITIHDIYTSKRVSLSSYFPLTDNSNAVIASLPASSIPGMPTQIGALERFLSYFILMTNNNLIYGRQVSKGVDWLLRNFDAPLISYLYTLNSTTIKIFMRKILPYVVKTGNVKIAKAIVHQRIEMASQPSSNRNHDTLEETCMAIAIKTEDNRMVQLLCEAGFLTQITQPYYSIVDSPYDDVITDNLPWRSGNIEILRTLLSFHTDPECLVKHTERGFPLVDAARVGNLEAVAMFLNVGCRVNAYVLPFFGTPLQAAVYSDNLEMAEYLIARGADWNAPYGTECHMLLQRLRGVGVKKCHEIALKTPIQIACDNNNIPLIEMLLARGALVDACPLSKLIVDDSNHYALQRTHHLLQRFPNYKAIRFQTALQYSVQNRNLALVHRLLSNGANPNTRAIPDWGDTPLQMSIRLDFPEIIETLLENGANVNASPGRVHGRTALQAAAESGNIQIAQALLKRNADINAPAAYKYGLTALQAAIMHAHPLMADYLMASGADLYAPPAPEGGFTAIHAAAETGDLNMIKVLIRQEAGVKGISASSAILAAISRKNMPMLKLLIEFTADNNNGLDDDGAEDDVAAAADDDDDNGDDDEEEEEEGERMPPIVAAAKCGWVDGIRYLLEMGADINSSGCDLEDITGNENYNPLGWSIIRDDHEMMRFLLERNADLQSDFSYHDDALCFALHNRCSRETIILLLDKFTELESISLSQHVLATALDLFDEEEIVFHMILHAISQSPKTFYESAIRNAWRRFFAYDNDLHEGSMIEATKILLKAGAKIDTETNSGHGTLLQSAISSRFMKLAEYLLREGADICVPATLYIGTPLQEAIRNHEVEFAYILLERGADVNASPALEGGVTALQAASSHGNKDLVVDLLERGADINALPARSRGVTALQAAAIRGRMDIAIELLQRSAHVAAAGAPLNGRTAIEGAAECGLENMLQLLLNHYDGDKDLVAVCEGAAKFAEKERHVEIGQWLREYPKTCL